MTKHSACRHISTLDLLRLEGRAEPVPADDALELIFRLGLAHEDAYLQSLRDRGLSVAVIEAPTATADRAQRELETLEAMRAGVDVVYQATFYDGSWGGQVTSCSGSIGRRRLERGPTTSRTPSSHAS